MLLLIHQVYWWAVIPEHDRVIEAQDIFRFVDDIVRRFAPQRVILFGSHAGGTVTESSDVDLLIVTDFEGEAHHAASRIQQAVGHPFAVDLLVRTPDQFRQRVALGDFFMREIAEKGLVLHDAADQRMGRQGRRRLEQRLAAAARPQAPQL